MFHQFKKFFKQRRYTRNKDIDPDEIFLDSQNLPDFDVSQFEGTIEKPIPKSTLKALLSFLLLVGVLFGWKVWDLQVVQGEELRKRSDNNSLRRIYIYADRGVIQDRNGKPLVSNTINPNSEDFSLRVYEGGSGLSTVLGYLKYPTKDSSGFYYQTKFEPKDGVEKIYDSLLSGENGIKIIETDVKGSVVSESVVQQPRNGTNVVLSIDAGLQKKLYESMLDVANRAGYKGGSGVIMDVRTGEILAMSSFPEYDSGVMTDGGDSAKISGWLRDTNYPFLNRAVNGLYTPGSIMKLFVGLGVLEEGVINPSKQILSTGTMTVPNPFFPDKPSVFVDWKAHGLVDFRRAIAVSSNIYFYQVTGGYGDQKGIGIDNIGKYASMFGFGQKTNINFPGEKNGTIPSPEWKEKNFEGEIWRLGDTYNTSIGQYGFQVSPLQAVRAVAALANGGKLYTPTLLKEGGGDFTSLPELKESSYRIVKEGMRQGVTEGTSGSLNFPFVKVASKTGTAQIGVGNTGVNSWVVGFWPYEDPKYAYAIVMERGSLNNQFGATLVMYEFLNWASLYAEEYLK
ncbi:MAG: penicillin-binding transpeptidase domain-containing protein [Patescibacteria group bacterium]